MIDQLEMLTQREQLMEDIDSICDEFFFELDDIKDFARHVIQFVEQSVKHLENF